MGINLNWNEIINQTVSQVITAISLFALSLFILDQKKIIKPWIYKYFNNTFKILLNSILKFLEILISPFSRIIISALLICLINIYNNIYFSVILFLIILTFLIRPKSYQRFLPVSDYSDEFKNLDSWEKARGLPEIENNFGKPVPDLILKYTGQDPVNSCLFHKKLEITKGIIECDFYLEPDAVFNIIFLADKKKEKWYMARFDSRSSDSDGFLIKTEGINQPNWNFHRMSGTHTSVHEWHRARIIINENKVAMYMDEQLIVEFDNPEQYGNHIGVFNEVNDVHVDNFTYTKIFWD